MNKGNTILISGAGIAGPTLAYWLSRYGFIPTLIERAPALRTGGYVMDFWGVGFDVAERMQLVPQLEQAGYRVREVRIVNDEGKRVGGFSTDRFRHVLDDRFVSILRSDLARLIYATLDGRVETVFGDEIQSLNEDEEGITVEFDRSPPRRFDLVSRDRRTSLDACAGWHSGRSPISKATSDIVPPLSPQTAIRVAMTTSTSPIAHQESKSRALPSATGKRFSS